MPIFIALFRLLCVLYTMSKKKKVLAKILVINLEDFLKKYLLLFNNCVKYWFLVFDFHEIFCSPSCITMSEINTPLPSRRPTTLSPRPLPGFLLRSTWRSWYKSVPSFFRSMIIFTAFSLVNRSVCRASLWVQSLKALPSTEIIKSPGLIRPSLSAAPSLWTSWTITPPWWWKK